MERQISEEMLSFIEKNKTAFHTVETIGRELKKQGFTELAEGGAFEVRQGGQYFVTRNRSGLIAFKVGTDLENYGFQIVASHTDSPCFKLKENAVICLGEKYAKLNTEGYGGMIRYTWLDRPLSVAGRVLVKEGEGRIVARTVDVDRDLCMIPSVAVHMNRDVNRGVELNMQTDMLPLLGKGMDAAGMTKLLADELSVEPDAIVGSDLYLYCREKGRIWGREQEYVSSPRLDDLQCVYASLQGFLQGANEKAVTVLACFDNEEVGSGTKQGASSTFLADVLKRLHLALGKDEKDYYRAVAKSFMISADNAHAVHPNHPELTDQNNHVFMNEGVVIKSHAGQKYTSDGMSIAILRELAKKSEVPLQYFANRSDKPGGSTLGNLAMAQVSMNCVDIGLPQLAMHAAVETAGVKDTMYMIRLLQTFYNSHITFPQDGIGVLE